jgi:hypothetical protein
MRAELARDLLGQNRLRDPAAVGAHHLMAPIFGDVRLDRRQFRHLMTARLPARLARRRSQRVLTMTTGVGK